jgi:hypothetical protein
VSRPLYENDATKAKEKALGDIVCAKWKCELQKVSIKYHVDCLALREGEAMAWVELRCRNNHVLQYPTLMISLAKVQGAKRLQEDTGLPVFLVVEWNDSVMFTNLGQCDFTLGFGGRNEIRDWQDQEPVCHIPIEQFQEFRQ